MHAKQIYYMRKILSDRRIAIPYLQSTLIDVLIEVIVHSHAKHEVSHRKSTMTMRLVEVQMSPVFPTTRAALNLTSRWRLGLMLFPHIRYFIRRR